MNLASESALAAMTIGELDKYIEQFQEYRAMVVTEISEHNNPVVGRFIERKEKVLADHVKKYSKIPTDGDPSDVVRALVAVQSFERYMLADLKALKIPDDVEKVLDEHTKMCNSAHRHKANADRTSR